VSTPPSFMPQTWQNELKMQKLRIVFTVLSLSLAGYLPAQDKSEQATSKAAAHPANSGETHDTSTLAYALRKGSEVDLHLRLYYMATNNQGELTDPQALAFGGGLKYTTGIYKGFQFTVGGFFVWNLASTDLSRQDPSTGAFSRYEVGQFDMEDLSNKSDLDRLEDFNLKYHFGNSTVTFGKQVLSSPFINPQDGRMRPTGEQGFWADISEIRNLNIQGGWLGKISPRGTVKWFSIGESIGIYPAGFNTEGGLSGYQGSLESRGIGVLGLKYKIRPKWSLQVWDYYVENIFNTFMAQSDGSVSLGAGSSIIAGLQYIRQRAVNDGGNESLDKTYFDPRQKANLISGRLGVRQGKNLLQANYTRITKDGRFLFPREWGREPLYTFLKRERNEGAGDVSAFTLNYLRDWTERVSTGLNYGYYDMPGVANLALNKYAMPSYHQFMVDMSYHFDGFLKGLNAEFLYTYKLDAEGVPTGKLTINKVNMHQFNFILNYHL